MTQDRTVCLHDAVAVIIPAPRASCFRRRPRHSVPFWSVFVEFHDNPPKGLRILRRNNSSLAAIHDNIPAPVLGVTTTGTPQARASRTDRLSPSSSDGRTNTDTCL